MELESWEQKLKRFVEESLVGDAAHDLEHLARVRSMAVRLAQIEGANLAVVIPAAWLHDCVMLSKADPAKHHASRLAAEKAVSWLRAQAYPEEYHAAIAHAIEAHSFSAGVRPLTIEAMVVQDADRLDALGAIGIARCFAVAGGLQRRFYEAEDPFGLTRALNDRSYALDHFYLKLLTLASSMQTQGGRAEAETRTSFMRSYLAQLKNEISGAEYRLSEANGEHHVGQS